MQEEKLTALEKAILNYLQTFAIGKDQAIKGHQLKEYLGISDQRVFRGIIHNLRGKGFPILSLSTKTPGYFWPSCPEEGEQALDELTGRIIEMRIAAKGIRKGLEGKFGQQIKLDLPA